MSGGIDSTASPAAGDATSARSSSASLRASRRFVFTRSPGFRGTNAGAMTWQLTRGVVI